MARMSKIYGYSDDIVCIEHIEGGCTEIDCYGKDVLLNFDDGTVARIGYPKANLSVWWAEIEEEGYAYTKLRVCEDEEASIYSDVLEVDAELESYSVVEQKYPKGKVVAR